MRRLTSAFAFLFMTLAAVGITTAPAQAASEVVVTPHVSVLYDTCGDYSYSYTANLPVAYRDSWSMELELLAPDGTVIDSDFLWDEPTSASDDFFICESPNLPGTYSVRGVGEACDDEYDCVPITVATSSFSMRLPQSRTSLRANVRNATSDQVVRFSVTSADERPNGHFGNDYSDVLLQVRKGSRWVNLSGTRSSTDSRGRTVIRARYTGGRKQVRAVTVATDGFTSSWSSPVTIH